ncbi:MAG: hypothetical protein ACREBU_01425 [Nitrososphaera sp.]
MKVYVFPADHFGCGYYRMIWPAVALRQNGHDVTVADPSQKSLLQGALRKGKLAGVWVPAGTDVVVLQRVTHAYLAGVVPMIRDQGVAVVIDMDDDLTCVDPANPAWAMLHPRRYPIHHSWENNLKACEAATMVTVSAPSLAARYASHGRFRVLHNMVPESYLRVSHIDSDLIGWAGSVHSHPNDLQVTGSAISGLIGAGHRFQIVGSGAGVYGALGVLDKQPRISATGIVPILAWPEAVTGIGVGIAPLADTEFNKSKSWLKPAEYSAVGVPWVASPRAEYTRLHKLGAGWLADSPSEWHSKLTTLVTDPQARTDLAGIGREVMTKHTIEGNAWRWWEAWTEALAIQRG